MTCFSFHPVKNITTGEGGAVLTRDPDLAEAAGPAAHPRHHPRPRPDARARRSLVLRDARPGAQRPADRPAGGDRPGPARRARDAGAGAAWTWSSATTKVCGTCPAVATQARPAGEDRTCWHLMIARTAGGTPCTAALARGGHRPRCTTIPVHLQPYYRHRFGTGPGDHAPGRGLLRQTHRLPLFPEADRRGLRPCDRERCGPC